MVHIDYALFEAPLGYAIFSVVHQANGIGLKLDELKATASNLAAFGKMVNLVNFTPFSGTVDALENGNLISEGILSDDLKSVLELNLPKTGGKKSKIVLAVAEKMLAGNIKAEFPGVECETPETSAVAGHILRGLRQHATKLVDGLEEDDIGKASLGLGHAYSRAKVKFSTTKDDNHITAAVSTINTEDKIINTLYMRSREWYSRHFPELATIVSDNYVYSKLVMVIRDKKTLTMDRVDDITAVIGPDEDKARAIVDAAQVSMGVDLREADYEMMSKSAELAVQSADVRNSMANYLEKKLRDVAPNLQALMGTIIASRLIAHAGSLTTLAKYPASTLQILGAEKSLFRALKTKGPTPKYGLIYNASAIGRASPRDKGRISRYLANKASMAARIDAFTEKPTSQFGVALKQQVEDRLAFYATGVRPEKNADVMERVIAFLGDDVGDTLNDVDEDEEMADASSSKKKKKSKKDKKRKLDDEEAPAVNGDEAEEVEEAEKKSKKKSKKSKKSKATDHE